MKEPQIITVSSHRPKEPYYCYDEFFASCRKYGHEPVTLGQHGEYKGLLSKPKLLLKYILQGLASPKIIVSDCWDVILLASPQAILEASRTYGKPIVFNAERQCFPRADLIERFPEQETPYRYLNSGFFAGETEAILTLLRKMRLSEIGDDFKRPDGSWHHENDQGNYAEAFVNNPELCAVDSDALICQTLHGEVLEDFLFDTSGERPMNLITHSQPMAFHANGGGKTGPVMPEVLKYYARQDRPH